MLNLQAYADFATQFMPTTKTKVREGENLAVYLDPDEYQEILKEAARVGLKKSDFVRRLIRIARPLVQKNPGLLLIPE